MSKDDVYMAWQTLSDTSLNSNFSRVPVMVFFSQKQTDLVRVAIGMDTIWGSETSVNSMQNDELIIM